MLMGWLSLKAGKIKLKVWQREALKSLMIIIGFIVFTQVAYVGLQLIFNTEIPIAVVSSGSMYPRLNIGDLIFIRGVDPAEIVAGPPPEGDIIVFDPPYPSYEQWLFWRVRVPWVHRVIEKRVGDDGHYYFRTKGDNNLYPDNFWVRDTNVYGKVFYQVPYVGYIRLWLNQYTPFIQILIIVLITTLLLWPKGRRVEKAE